VGKKGEERRKREKEKKREKEILIYPTCPTV
jgi:hypothetical protein